MRRQLTAAVIAALGLAGSSLAGCGHGEGEQAGSGSAPPATTEVVDGNVQRVTLTADAMQKLGIKTQPVAAPAGNTAAKAVIPLDAVIYDPDGASWTYTNTQPLSYVRQSIAIDRVVGNQVVLRDGPVPGTAVVTVGAPELLGIEYGVGEE